MKTILIRLVLIFAFGMNLSAQENVQNTKSIFWLVEEMPVFPYESMTIYEYLEQKIDYNGKENYLILSFDIEKDGTILNVEVKKNNDEYLCEKIKEVLKNTPPWKPGKQNEQNVKVKLTTEILLPVFKKPTYELGIELGDKCFVARDYSSAITYYNRSYLIEKSDDIKEKLAETYIELGKENLIQKDTSKACSYFRKAISKASNNTKAKKYLRKYCD